MGKPMKPVLVGIRHLVPEYLWVWVQYLVPENLESPGMDFET